MKKSLGMLLSICLITAVRAEEKPHSITNLTHYPVQVTIFYADKSKQIITIGKQELMRVSFGGGAKFATEVTAQQMHNGKLIGEPIDANNPKSNLVISYSDYDPVTGKRSGIKFEADQYQSFRGATQEEMSRKRK